MTIIWPKNDLSSSVFVMSFAELCASVNRKTTYVFVYSSAKLNVWNLVRNSAVDLLPKLIASWVILPKGANQGKTPLEYAINTNVLSVLRALMGLAWKSSPAKRVANSMKRSSSRACAWPRSTGWANQATGSRHLRSDGFSICVGRC